MLNDTVHINEPDTKGPIEMYLQYVMQRGTASPESRILTDELLDPLTDESSNELMR